MWKFCCRDNTSSSNMEIDVEQRDLRTEELKRAFSEMGDSPKESLQHLTLNAEGLNHDLVYPFRAVIEAAIKGENTEWPLLKNIMAAYFASRMREYGKKNPKYAKYISGVNEMGVLATEGVKVNTIINTLVFDFKHLWKGIDILTKGRLFRNVKQIGELELYPVTNFDFDLKKHFLYEAFEEAYPGLIRKIIKNKLMVYVTSDFNFAVSQSVLDIATVSEQVLAKKYGNVIELNDGVKLYLFEGI